MSNKDIAARVEKLERGHEQTASVIADSVEGIDRLASEVDDARRGGSALDPKSGEHFIAGNRFSLRVFQIVEATGSGEFQPPAKVGY